MNRNSWIALLVGLIVACACACVLAIGAGTFIAMRVLSERSARPTPTARAARATPTLEPLQTPFAPTALAPATTPAGTPGLPTQPIVTATPRITATQSAITQTADAATYSALMAATIPEEDVTSLAIRYRGAAPEQTVVKCDVTPKGFDVGDTRQFRLSNQDKNAQFTITAELRYKTANVYMWVETTPKRLRIDDGRLRRGADAFQQKIYPTTRAFFGEEANPGVDCDPRLHIVHAAGLGSTTGGYFSSPDSFPKTVRPDSNEGEMFVIHADVGYNGANPSSGDYLGTLAHEFQHMISQNQTRAGDLWLEEGAAQLSEKLNGYAELVGTSYDFARNPETQLNTWSESSPGENSAHYGGAYLFWSYLYDRFGENFVKSFARAKQRNVASLIQTMKDAGIINPDTGKPYAFDELFADWVIANFQGKDKLSNDGGAPGRFNYSSIDIPPMKVYERFSASAYPVQRDEQLNQFGTHYYELRSTNPLAVEFSGDTLAHLLPPSENGGKFWYSNRADSSNMRLTREFDLSATQRATLKFRAWYRIEKDYDYGYVAASADGGKTWKTLKTESCSTEDPNTANLGCGYTGSSGGVKDAPRWLSESADLTAYAGKKVLLRFELVTDAGVNRDGLVIDDIEIPEIGFKDEANNATGWTAEGWVLAKNELPQGWAVQLILEQNDGRSFAQRMLLTNGQGSAQIKFGRNADEIRSAVLVVSPTTLVTTEKASYRLGIR